MFLYKDPNPSEGYYFLKPMYLYLYVPVQRYRFLQFIVPSTYKFVYANIPVGDVFI